MCLLLVVRFNNIQVKRMQHTNKFPRNDKQVYKT
jgi:hypothetical protein